MRESIAKNRGDINLVDKILLTKKIKVGEISLTKKPSLVSKNYFY
jgi:hypothetical protein